MAMVDYGVVAIKNGKVINAGIFFMNMLTAVGWVDYKRIRHDDCKSLPFLLSLQLHVYPRLCT